MNYNTPPSSCQRVYAASQQRYARGDWRSAGTSGLKISPITIGTWQNFSDLDPRESVRNLYLTAFDNGIFSFDFGNNYGRPPGSAEELFGSFITRELHSYRNELVIATKAGYDMWPGPNGVGSSLKYLITSLDESLKRLKLDYVDIFYSHRYDPTTPIEETAEALDLARRSGRCLYIGISSYPIEAANAITEALEKRGTPVIINQSHYNLFNRWVEPGLFSQCQKHGTGFAAFSPLAQGLLSNKYVPGGTGAGRVNEINSSTYCNDWKKLRVAHTAIGRIAARRSQTISQLAISWVLRRPETCTAVVGARTSEQILENIKIDTAFSGEEEQELATICDGIDVDLWKESRMAHGPAPRL
jgi:L-glyceraldehyde 3-phosphate reductase